MIAGGLIQDYYHYCRIHGIRFLLVIDEAYSELLQGFLPDDVLLYYPRQRIKQGSFWQQASTYLHCLLAIRRFKADIAFNIEEDSVSHRLTQLSGARFKLGSNLQRNRHGYNLVLDINHLQRNPKRRHRWYGYEDIFKQLGLNDSKPAYLKFSPHKPIQAFMEKLTNAGLEPGNSYIILHSSAAKDYKKWPAENFAELIYRLQQEAYSSVLIGAGIADQQANQAILEILDEHYPDVKPIDLCNQLSLSELAELMRLAQGMVGNDSGPFHLASAIGLPGCVIFGPTDVELWRPLSEKSLVLKADTVCAPECTKTGCIYENRCLKATTPGQVLQRLLPLIGK
jgi:ADP-heptose:LPS heptosyltransferase